MQLWRGGCIIQCDCIVDLLGSKEIGNELSKAFPSLKVILKAIEAYANITSLSASLEYHKYGSGIRLLRRPHV
jgi:hypothetical protein